MGSTSSPLQPIQRNNEFPAAYRFRVDATSRHGCPRILLHVVVFGRHRHLLAFAAESAVYAGEGGRLHLVRSAAYNARSRVRGDRLTRESLCGRPTCAFGTRMFVPQYRISGISPLQRQFGNSTTLRPPTSGRRTITSWSLRPICKRAATRRNRAQQPVSVRQPCTAKRCRSGLGYRINGNQSYNALQATLQRRFANGLQGQVAYTYSKCMTDSTGFYGVARSPPVHRPIRKTCMTGKRNGVPATTT